MTYILFIICVLGFSVTTCFSETAETYLRDKNPQIWCWNWTLFAFAVVLANIVRIPLGLNDALWIWATNLGICLATGCVIFFLTLFCSITYHVFWPLFRLLFFPEH